MNYYTWTHQCWLTSKDLYTSALCRHWMPSRGAARTNRWEGWIARENQRTSCYQKKLSDDDNDVYLYIEIN